MLTGAADMERDRLRVLLHLLEHCGSLAAGERFLLIVDATTKHLTSGFRDAAERLGAVVNLEHIDVADRHGAEPPPHVAELMRESDLVAGLTKMSLAHTRARQVLCAKGGRYLSLPGYSDDLLADPCVLADFRGQYRLTRSIADAFSRGSAVCVSTARGTDVRLDIRGRDGNCCPGFVDRDNRLGSPPDIEANVSPVEHESAGVIVIDGSITCDGLGLLDAPVVLTISECGLLDVRSDRADYVAVIRHLFARVGDPKAYVLAECGVGLNPLATLTGNMLSDEGALGCVHFGFGSNSTVGGLNEVPFHVDFVCRSASLWVDDQQILADGRLCVELTT